MSKAQKFEISRRQFLKLSAATAAVVAITDKVFGSNGPNSILVAHATSAIPSNEVKYGFCRNCHRTYCPTVYTIKDGVITQVEGDVRGPWSEGRLCVRGSSTAMHVYNPFRVKSPLKRTNPKKGLDVDPGWVEISWDEALNTVAGKLKTIRNDDPNKFVFMSGFGGDYTLLNSSFTRAHGTVNSLSATGAMCSVHWASGLTHATSTEQVDPGYCNYCITIGNALGPNLGSAEPGTRDPLDGVDRGMRLIVVDSRASAESSKGEWVPIRPGTELAFMLGFANVILHELNKFDVWFVKNRSNGPYLIGADGNYLRDPASKKPLVWDPTDNKSKTFDDATIKDYALEGNYTVAGASVRTAFSYLKEGVKNNTPEWTEKITSIPAATLRRIAHDFVEAAQIGSTITIDGVNFPLRPAAITVGRGMTGHFAGHLAYWMAMVNNILVGAMDVPGGDNGTEPGPKLKPDADGVVTPFATGTNSPNAWKFPPDKLDASQFYYYGFSQGYRFVDTILEPDKYYIKYKPEMLLTFGTNFYTKASGDGDRIGDSFRQIPFIASISYHLDEHTAFADIVLPESSVPERYLMATITERKCWSLSRTNYSGNLVNQPIVPPVYQSMQADAIMLELANRGGFALGKGGMNDLINAGLQKDYILPTDKAITIDQVIDATLKSQNGPASGLAAFKGAGFAAEPLKPSQLFAYSYFPGNKTRHPIYNVQLKKVGEDTLANLKKAGVAHPAWSEDHFRTIYQPVPAWIEGPVFKAAPEFDFFGSVWKTPPFLFDISNTNANPYLQEVAMSDPLFGSVLINTKTAAKKGLRDGDMVYVESQFGGKIGPVPIKTTELVHTEVAGFASGLSRRVFGMNPIAANGLAYNRLLTTRQDSVDVITASIELSPRLKIYKA